MSPPVKRGLPVVFVTRPLSPIQEDEQEPPPTPRLRRRVHTPVYRTQTVQFVFVDNAQTQEVKKIDEVAFKNLL